MFNRDASGKSNEGRPERGVFCPLPHVTMKTSRSFALLVVLGALSTVAVRAEFESFKVDPTFKPQLSPVMLMQGVTEGTVVIAIDLSETGQITDHLVLGSTHPALVDPCVDALKSWKFTPARLNGSPVPVQSELTVNYSAQGVVISRPAVLDLDQQMQRVFGYKFVSRRRATHELDHAVAPVSVVAPRYAIQAEKDGVKGQVRVHFYIDEKGSVRLPAIEGEAHPYLSSQALAAVREWRFSPPTSNGKPVLVAVRQDFQFSP